MVLNHESTAMVAALKACAKAEQGFELGIKVSMSVNTSMAKTYSFYNWNLLFLDIVHKSFVMLF